jgi:hypothetical protein
MERHKNGDANEDYADRFHLFAPGVRRRPLLILPVSRKTGAMADAQSGPYSGEILHVFGMSQKAPSFEATFSALEENSSAWGASPKFLHHGDQAYAAKETAQPAGAAPLESQRFPIIS